MPKKTFHHGNLKEACVETGLRLIAEQGVDGLSLRDVARRLGVSHGAPYKHFSNKEDLIAAITERGFDLFGQKLRAAIDQGDKEPYQRFSDSGHVFLSFAMENPDFYRLLFGNAITDIMQYPEVVGRGLETFEYVRAMLADFSQQGVLAVDNTFISAIYLLSQVHGYCSLVIENRFQVLAISPEAYHENLEALLKLTWKGLR